MANLRHCLIVNPKLRPRAATAALALAIVFVFAAVTPNTAHAQSFQVLYNFTGGSDGAQPYAGLTMDRAGNLYGTTHSGNQGTNWGNVYELRQHGTGWIFNALELFDGALESGVVFGPNGTLYGTSPNNISTLVYGYVYNLAPPINSFCHSVMCHWNSTVLYGFTGGADGWAPRYGSLVFDSAGNMYDTTSLGGNGNGVVFEMSHSGPAWTEQPIYTFSGADGANPFSGVIFDSAGNLYGTTTQGGANGFGAVYELTRVGLSWTEKVLYSFQGGNDGSLPTAGVILDQAGDLYGSTNAGGAGGGGTVFELTPSGGNWNYSLIHSFTGGSDCGPWGNLNFDAAGNLVGTTLCDGAFNAGNVFRLTNSGGTWTYTSVYDFTGGDDGKYPYCNVIFDTAGDMFGTAFRGGTVGQGTVWEITP